MQLAHRFKISKSSLSYEPLIETILDYEEEMLEVNAVLITR